MKTLGVVVLLGVTANPLAAAQAPTAGRPAIELGASGVVFGGLLDVSDFMGDPQTGARGFSPHVTVKLTRRASLEAGVDVFRVSRESGRSVFSSYHRLGLLIRLRETRNGQSFRFINAGVGGHFEAAHVPEIRNTRRDQSVTVYPAYERRELTPVNFGFAGIGVQRTVTSHLAVRGEIDGLVGRIGVGVRLTAGVSVPLGTYRRR